MKRTMLIAATAVAAMAVASPAGAASDRAKNEAAKQCAADKKADKGAFKALHGKHAMRKCIKGDIPEAVHEFRNASKECKADRGEFETHGKCVRSKVRAERREDTAEFKDAAQECRAERRDSPTFHEDYGNNNNNRNALGKCVSQKVRAAENGS